MAKRKSNYSEGKQNIIKALLFADSKNIAAYALDAVVKMQQANIISGKENEKFEPESNTTRAEACKMVALLLQKMGK